MERSRIVKKWINISVRGPQNPESLLRIVEDALKLLIVNWFSVNYRTFIACPHCLVAQQEAEQLLLIHNNPVGEDMMPLPYFFEEQVTSFECF